MDQSAQLIFTLSPEQQKHLFAAEKELLKAGVKFDTGMARGERIWELDWSLHGARLVVKPKTTRWW